MSGYASYGNPSSTWEALGETFYKKQDVYSMQWNLDDLTDYVIVGARAGGPIGEHSLHPGPSGGAELSPVEDGLIMTAAVMRDQRKPVLFGTAGLSGKPRIAVYSASGGLIQTIQVSTHAPLPVPVGSRSPYLLPS